MKKVKIRKGKGFICIEFCQICNANSEYNFFFLELTYKEAGTLIEMVNQTLIRGNNLKKCRLLTQSERAKKRIHVKYDFGIVSTLYHEILCYI